MRSAARTAARFGVLCGLVLVALLPASGWSAVDALADGSPGGGPTPSGVERDGEVVRLAVARGPAAREVAASRAVPPPVPLLPAALAPASLAVVWVVAELSGRRPASEPWSSWRLGRAPPTPLPA